MADRFPLVANESAGQIQEIPAGDNLNLSSNSIVGVGSVTATSFFGDGSALTGIAATGNINTDSVNVAGVVTATQFKGSGANLTNLTAGAISTPGTLPALDGSALTGISAGGMTLVHKAVVGSSSTVAYVDFTNLDYDSIYKIVGKVIVKSSNYYNSFRPYINGGSTPTSSACQYSYTYYWSGYSNSSGDWKIHDGGYYSTSYGNNSEFEFEFHTGTPCWVRGTGHYFQNYQSVSNMWGNFSSSYTPYSSYRISGMRVRDENNYTFNAGSTFLLYKYNES